MCFNTPAVPAFTDLSPVVFFAFTCSLCSILLKLIGTSQDVAVAQLWKLNACNNHAVNVCFIFNNKFFKCIRANTTLHVVGMLLDFNMKPSETENTLGADQRSQT